MATIHVSNLSHQTTEEEIRQFFSYCGKISDLSIKPATGEKDSPLSATITFERKPAADTALLLDNTELHGNKVKVESTASLDDLSKSAGGAAASSSEQEHENELRQEDKPRTAVLAEYLSQGYTIADNMLQKGIALDHQHGYSDKFKTYLQKLEQKTNAHATARSVDTTYGVSDKAMQGVNVFQRYFEKALNTPTGQKVRSFYEVGHKTAMDIHNEAMRLKKLRENKGGECTCGGESGKCTCPEGQCNCATCVPGGATGSASGEKPGVYGVGDGKTKCSCAGNEGECKCVPGECACEGCQKKHQAA